MMMRLGREAGLCRAERRGRAGPHTRRRRGPRRRGAGGHGKGARFALCRSATHSRSGVRAAGVASHKPHLSATGW